MTLRVLLGWKATNSRPTVRSGLLVGICLLAGVLGWLIVNGFELPRWSFFVSSALIAAFPVVYLIQTGRENDHHVRSQRPICSARSPVVESRRRRASLLAITGYLLLGVGVATFSVLRELALALVILAGFAFSGYFVFLISSRFAARG